MTPKAPRPSCHKLPHRNLQFLPESEHHPSNLETSKNHPNTQTKQRPWSRNLIQTNFTALTHRQNHGIFHTSQQRSQTTLTNLVSRRTTPPPQPYTNSQTKSH